MKSPSAKEIVQRYRVQQDKGVYALKGCDDGDLVDYGSYERVLRERDEAIAMLADWCAMVDVNGTGWDDWDEGYKSAMYRPCGIRLLLDIAIKEAEKAYER